MLNPKSPHARKVWMSIAVGALLLLRTGSAHGGMNQLADARLCLGQVGALEPVCVLHAFAPNVQGSARAAAIRACQHSMLARLQVCGTRAGVFSPAPTGQSAHPTSGDLSETPLPTSVTTDKPGYHLGDIMTITGSNWQTGETVVMVLSVDPPTHPAVQLTSVADEDGNFTNTKYTIQRSDAGVVFSLTATGRSSEVTAQTAAFTD